MNVPKMTIAVHVTPASLWLPAAAILAPTQTALLFALVRPASPWTLTGSPVLVSTKTLQVIGHIWCPGALLIIEPRVGPTSFDCAQVSGFISGINFSQV